MVGDYTIDYEIIWLCGSGFRHGHVLTSSCKPSYGEKVKLVLKDKYKSYKGLVGKSGFKQLIQGMTLQTDLLKSVMVLNLGTGILNQTIEVIGQ
jgi:hypothetical protein